MLLLTSVSKVKFNFLCSLLMYRCNCLVCLVLPLYRSNMSSTYLYQYNIFISVLIVLFVEYVGLFDIVDEYFSEDAGNR